MCKVTKRVRSDHPLGGLSSGWEVPSAPPENGLTINRRSQRCFWSTFSWLEALLAKVTRKMAHGTSSPGSQNKLKIFSKITRLQRLASGLETALARRSGHARGEKLISHKVFMNSFRKSHFPHKYVNLFCIYTNMSTYSVLIKDKLTDLCGN